MVLQARLRSPCSSTLTSSCTRRFAGGGCVDLKFVTGGRTTATAGIALVHDAVPWHAGACLKRGGHWTKTEAFDEGTPVRPARRSTTEWFGAGGASHLKEKGRQRSSILAGYSLHV